MLDKSKAGCWLHSGSSRVSHHCDLGSIPAQFGYLIKITSVTCENSVVQFLFTKHRTADLAHLVIQYK